jgi:hypothetical protein
MSPFLHASMFSEVRKQKTKLMENGKYRLFATKRDGKRKFDFLGQQTINGFSKPAYLCTLQSLRFNRQSCHRYVIFLRLS